MNINSNIIDNDETGDVKETTSKFTSTVSNNMEETIRFTSTVSDNMLKIKTLTGITSIMINTNNQITGNEIKELLCSNTCILPDDILLIKGGKEIKNDHVVFLQPKTTTTPTKLDNNNNDNNKKKIDEIFAIIRSTSTSKAELVIKNKNDNKVYNLSYQANMKIYQLRKEISKITGIRSSACRMILGARLLKDEGILGDYILSVIKKNKLNLNLDHKLVIQVSRVIDITTDIDIKVHFPNKSIIEFSMEVGVPMMIARQILAKRFFMPLSVPLEIYLDKAFRNKLDYTRSLIDYGICPTPGKKTCVDLFLRVYNGEMESQPKRDCLDQMIDQMIGGFSSTFKTLKGSKSKQQQQPQQSTKEVTKTSTTTVAPTKKSTKGGLFSSMKRGFLSSGSKKDCVKENDCIITKDDNTPIKIKKMSNVTKQVLKMSENNLNHQ